MNLPVVEGLMAWVLIGFAVEAIGALATWPRIKKIAYGVLVGYLPFSLAVILMTNLSFATVGFAVVAVFRLLSAFRVFFGRTTWQRLSGSLRRSSMVLILSSAALVLIGEVLVFMELSLELVLRWLLSVLLFAACLALVSVRSNLAKTKMHPSDKYLSDKDLPSVSVCVPARNEGENLPGCLSSIVESDYPKLEILVVDDCSQDRTSEIIKGFAQDGVRFIPGDIPKDDWLAKNQAYQALYEHASGQILIFCGVDVRLGKDAIRSVVVTMLARDKKMISVMPKGAQKIARARLLQPMRYWWELALPRRLFNRPPVLSTFWAIDKKIFKKLGTMKAVKNSVMPETYFAKATASSVDGYSFMRSGGRMDLVSVKPYVDQLQTSIRTRYPRLRSRIENVLFVAVLELCMMSLPFVGLVVFWLQRNIVILVLSLSVIAVLMTVHWLIVRAWGVANPVLALVLLPVVITSEALITLVSMWRYEFAEVRWKDRDICIPAMRYYKKLPDF